MQILIHGEKRSLSQLEKKQQLFFCTLAATYLYSFLMSRAVKNLKKTKNS